MKLREFFKTLILTCLVISSVILASKIWFSEELWSDGYNSFSYDGFFIPKISSLFKKEPAVKPLEYNQIFFPKQLMLTDSDSTVLISPSDENYKPISEDIKQILGKMFEGFTISEITNDEFRRACRSASVFVDFYNNTSFKMLGDYFGVANNTNTDEINNIRQLLIPLDEQAIYARNNQSGKIFRLGYTADTTQYTKRAEETVKSGSKGEMLYSYAFENGFDLLPEDSDGPERMLLDPYIIINIDSMNVPKTEAVSLIKERENEIYPKLLEAFNMKINTSRYFSESDGTVNYVENYAKLRLSKNGYFEYVSIDETKGLELGTNLVSDYDIIKGAGEFLEKVNSICPLPDRNGYVFNRLEKDGDKYRIYFDITYNGIPVLVSGFGNLKNNVEITVDGTKIVSYKQAFVAYKAAGGRVNLKNMITALDDFYSVYGAKASNELKITDMHNTYYCNGKNKAIGVRWIVSLSNNEQVIVEGN